MSIVRVLGVARHRAAAEAALLGLALAGFPLAQLSVLLRPEPTGASGSTGAVAVAPGTFGPLVDVRSVGAPTRPLLAAGPLGNAAGDGAERFGTTPEQARRYHELLDSGSVVCAIETFGAGEVALARAVLREHGAVDIATASSHPRPSAARP